MKPVLRSCGVMLLLAAGIFAGGIGGGSFGGGSFAGITTPAMAITAEEMLDDPTLESRARELSKQLRCLVCQNQSIDDSDAELARDLRREVRGQLMTGATDSEIIETLRGKYGDYLLLNPPISSGTYILWLAPLAVLIGGAGLVLAARRTRRTGAATGQDQEQAHEPVAGGDDRASESGAGSGAGAGSGYIYIAGGALVLAASLGLYLMLGRADLGDQPLAQRQAEIETAAKAQNQQAETLAAALARAKQQTIDEPTNVGNWLRLAQAAAMADDNQTEIRALTTAREMTGGDVTVKSMLAEALSRAAGGQITVPARTLIASVLASSPDEPRALYLAGLAAYQDEDYARAVSIWQRLRTVSANDAPWMSLLDDNIADAAVAGGIDIPEAQSRPGPDEADIAAAAEMSDDDRTAMIEGMVSGLAEKLAENPDDVDGWRRLGRAYEVLGRPTDAASALISAADAVPQDIDQQVTALQMIVTSGLGRHYITPASRLIERATLLAPDRLDLLFLRGHFAKLEGKTDKARELWQRLLGQLPADSPFSDDLKAAIAAL
jgi:cytochrome c-type biogenesis protein CcmH